MPEERCNGIDDNGNGSIDEDWPELGDPCTVGIGACEATGAIVCDPADVMSTVCNAVEGQPLNEEDFGCDGVDNDCDGDTDEHNDCCNAADGDPCSNSGRCYGGECHDAHCCRIRITSSDVCTDRVFDTGTNEACKNQLANNFMSCTPLSCPSQCTSVTLNKLYVEFDTSDIQGHNCNQCSNPGDQCLVHFTDEDCAPPPNEPAVDVSSAFNAPGKKGVVTFTATLPEYWRIAGTSNQMPGATYCFLIPRP